MTICFVTDCRAGEEDILVRLAFEDLVVRGEQGITVAHIRPPFDGWTHDVLMHVGARIAEQHRDALDAFLGGEWVGSTEV